MSAPAGWHRQDDGRDRYWDGQQWTEQFREGAQPQQQPEVAEPAPGGVQSWWGSLGTMKQIPIAIAGGFAVLALMAMCQGAGGSRGPDEYDVQVTCRDLVRDQLVNPSTARFSEQTQSMTEASGVVVSENRLGGRVTMNYRCTASDGVVRLASLAER